MVKYQVIEREAFTIMGRATTILIADKYTMLPEFWQKCKMDGTIANLHELAGNRPIIGAGTNDSQDSFRYMIGMAKTADFNDMETMIIPKSKWVVFEPVISEPKYVGPVWEYIFNDFLLNGKYNLANTPDLEVNRKIGIDRYTCEIWIPVIEKANVAV